MNSKKQLNKISKKSTEIGDDFYNKYKKNKITEDAVIAIRSYNTAIRSIIVKYILSKK